MFKLFKVWFFLLIFIFTTHTFAKSNDYYQETLMHVLTKCNSTCQKKIFEQEVNQAFFVLIDAILNEVRFKLNQSEKKIYD